MVVYAVCRGGYQAKSLLLLDLILELDALFTRCLLPVRPKRSLRGISVPVKRARNRVSIEHQLNDSDVAIRSLSLARALHMRMHSRRVRGGEGGSP